jgi:hypothetical protein
MEKFAQRISQIAFAAASVTIGLLGFILSPKARRRDTKVHYAFEETILLRSSIHRRIAAGRPASLGAG